MPPLCGVTREGKKRKVANFATRKRDCQRSSVGRRKESKKKSSRNKKRGKVFRRGAGPEEKEKVSPSDGLGGENPAHFLAKG